MNSISQIRGRLGVTQSALANALGVSQGNISHYERGQGVPPEVAKRLISYASSMGMALSFDDIYGAPAALPERSRRATDPAPTAGHGGRQPASPHNILDTVPSRAVITTTGEKS